MTSFCGAMAIVRGWTQSDGHAPEIMEYQPSMTQHLYFTAMHPKLWSTVTQHLYIITLPHNKDFRRLRAIKAPLPPSLLLSSPFHPHSTTSTTRSSPMVALQIVLDGTLKRISRHATLPNHSTTTTTTTKHENHKEVRRSCFATPSSPTPSLSTLLSSLPLPPPRRQQGRDMKRRREGRRITELLCLRLLTRRVGWVGWVVQASRESNISFSSCRIL